MWALCQLGQEQTYEPFLTEGEKKDYTMAKCHVRKMEWLSSRVALKKILMEGNLIQSPLHCQTEKDRFGRPHLTIYKEDSSTTMNCSIAHKKGMASVCISWFPNLKMGIDLETLSEKPWRLRNAFVGQEDSLTSIPESQKYYAVLWACKEAASKAIGLGMATDFKKLKVTGDDNKRFSILENGQKTMHGSYFFFHNFIVAICLQISSTLGAVDKRLAHESLQGQSEDCKLSSFFKNPIEPAEPWCHTDYF